MKKLIILLLLSCSLLSGQEYKVTKISGNVLVQKGVSEEWNTLHKNDILTPEDVIMTDENSMIQLQSEENRFLLNSNAAIGLDKIKKVSLNELLLAFALEEIERATEKKNNSEVKNSSAYGAKEGKANESVPPNSVIGERKLNGAIQLAENGYKNSAILVAKETFRVYPQTQKDIKTRLYFVNLLYELGLYNEAYTEIRNVRSSTSSVYQNEIKTLEEKIAAVLGNQ